MLTYQCDCGATLFFDSTHCVACGLDCGWCDSCRRIASVKVADGVKHCGNPDCGVVVFPCVSAVNWSACNALVGKEGNLCRSCVTTTDLPDLSQGMHLPRWRLLEEAKRRLIYDLDRLGIAWEINQPNLTFRFLADTPEEHVITGHENGVVTINLDEADPVAREKARQEFGEPQRTLIGHLRHEASHYLWQTHVQGRDEAACVRLFGDHNNPSYSEAMPAYYEQGPPDDWAEHFISAYASSHPWEDFAETAAFYLDMRSVVETVGQHFGRNNAPVGRQSCDTLLANYSEAGFGLNEVNRCLGLTDALPEVVSPPVVEKLRYIDSLLSRPVG
ncbi:hypothetical protein Pla108_15870 [Botrimarina colliarenosi]|uniref:Zinc-ribbon domain-containing protein n=1 Tax=Botrimarina colliarenosi TaxID=2528001 RepID=A0A5C6AKT4_9BACT|nr:putative zinc-binding metallopeptidase [Botrimarina colliarenosi]TWU00635.1 hypothetical protein Pla108_15870 [Botrimarina colliarenosi]